MKDMLKQLSGLIGAGIAAACCLGVPVVLSALGAAGLGFLIKDAYLFPIFVGFIGLSLWMVYRSARAHGKQRPFWLALAGGTLAIAGLWLIVTGLLPISWLLYPGLAAVVVGSIWDFMNGRRAAALTMHARGTPATGTTEAKKPVTRTRRMAVGASLAVAAAAAFYGMYESVETFAPEARAGEIACWGINGCKGETACATAFNSCTGQNECKGQGYVFVPEKDCYLRGGLPLAGSEADPKNG